MDHAAGQVAIPVVVADDNLVNEAVVNDGEGTRATFTDDLCVIGTNLFGTFALADGAVSHRLAGQKRRWWWIEELSDGLSGKRGSCEERHRSKERDQQ